MNSVYQERMAAAMAAALAAKGSMAPENAAEMRLYLDKLKDLVPLCPKNRKVTKLELIQHVIDYISDLQDTLQSDSESESPPESPIEHMSFTDAYNRPQQHAGYSAQQPSHSMGTSSFLGYASDCSNNGASGYSGIGFNGASAQSNAHDFDSASGYSSMESDSSFNNGFFGVPSNSFGGNYSTILYSDHGSSNGPGFGSSS
ncbi:uncharacterized protein [Panulirus ornatus]|uniref:uncharacterized protein n=1 Tax=Panulirus ornatus TaxID=150431 RepID=UPI003A86062B